MRAFVFTDPALASQAGRFVWLEIDAERRENAALRKRLAITALPTFYVLDPKDERVALRWVGSATTSHLSRILDDARLAVASGGTAGATRRAGAPADRALARADSLYGAADWAGAVPAYEAAIAAADANWPRYGRAVEALLYALTQTGGHRRGAELGLAAWPRVKGSPSSAAVAAGGLDHAISLPDSDAARAGLVAALEPIVREVVADTALPMSADDRSGVYISLLDARESARDSAGARGVAEAWSAFLDREAARATTPEARVVFDSHRLSAYLETGRPEEAVPMLEASESDFPDDYNPPARLALAYRAMKRWDRALAASDRAMAKAYGPRKLLFFQNRADIHLGAGDSTAARRALEDAVGYAESLPEGQRNEITIAGLRRRIAAIGGTPAAKP
jgi:tetratricopeptide (TPR) repeat protein